MWKEDNSKEGLIGVDLASGDDTTVISVVCETMEQGSALNAILIERKYQDEKHGPLSGAGAHTLGEWILLIEAELAEAKQALIKGGHGRNTVRHEITQVGALCVAMLEQHGTVDPHDGRQI